jgi:hypothetical protein
LILSNAIFLIVLAYLTGIMVKSPEFAALSYIFINVLILLLNLNFSFFILDVFQSDLQYKNSNPLLLFSLSVLASGMILAFSLFKKLNKDLNL